MIMLHNAIDSCKKLLNKIGVPSEIKDAFSLITKEVLDAKAFDFGKFSYSDFDSIQSDSKRCWNNNLLDFPFESVVFQHEWEEQRDEDHSGISIYYCTTMTCNQVYYLLRSVGTPIDDAFWTKIAGQDMKLVMEFRQFKDEHGNKLWLPPMGMVFLGRDCAIDDHMIYTCLVCPWTPPGAREAVTTKFREDNEGASILDSPLAMALFLNTKGVSTELIAAPDRLNKQRRILKKTPIPAYHVVKIAPITEQHGPNQGGTHASPRVHYRRGHIRTLATGEKTWVRACIVSGNDGAIVPGHYRAA